jgi:hypothetical protein
MIMLSFWESSQGASPLLCLKHQIYGEIGLENCLINIRIISYCCLFPGSQAVTRVVP